MMIYTCVICAWHLPKGNILNPLRWWRWWPQIFNQVF